MRLPLSDVIGRAEEAYKSAYKLSEVLKATHPIRLGLALNYSVFHYEIKNDPGEACNVAKEVTIRWLFVDGVWGDVVIFV